MSFGFRSLHFEHYLPLLFYSRNHKLLKLFVASERTMSGKSKAKVFVTRDDFPPEGINLLKERQSIYSLSLLMTLYVFK